MANTITPSVIKQNNKKLIYRFIYKNRTVSQQDIIYQLHLSRPTVTNKLAELEAEGLILKGGPMETELVGRKALSYSIVPDYRIAIGVEIQRNVVKMICVNLYGEYSHRTVLPMPFSNTPAYFDTLCHEINSYIEQLSIDPARVLGIGFSVLGLVSSDGTTITYGEILNFTGLTTDIFRGRLNYPCRFFHDTASAAEAELWLSPETDAAMYLNISAYLGSALIYNHKIVDGLHGHTGTVEHIRMRPGGKRCYCGKKGCMETLCSLNSLLGETCTEASLDDFFTALRAGDPDIRARWNEYLKNLSQAINMMHLLYDTHYVLGGYLAPYLTDTDLQQIYAGVELITPFTEPRDFLSVSKMPKHSITIGAALPFIRDFLENYAFA